MTCCGQHKTMDGKPALKWDAHDVRATEPCVFCAEKHLSTAYALSMETGYSVANRCRIIGELVEAQWHIWQTNLPLAEELSAMRHLIQQRKESSVKWDSALEKMNAVVENELRE